MTRNVFGQAPSIQWEKCLGGSGFDAGLSVQQTNDGGYIVGGNSTSNNGNVTGNHGGYDCWVVKLDVNSSIQWQKSFGGSGTDYLRHIVQTKDGGYIWAGMSLSNDGDVTGNHGGIVAGDFWVMKLDSLGNKLWQKTYGGSSDEDAMCVQQTTDGGFIIAGLSLTNNNGDVTGNHGGDDAWIIKIDSLGNLI